LKVAELFPAEIFLARKFAGMQGTTTQIFKPDEGIGGKQVPPAPWPGQ
jgi:hypothetical protein